MALQRLLHVIVKAITLNELSVLPVFTTLKGEYGIKNVAVSVPCIIGQDGIESILQIPLVEDEVQKLHDSAEGLKTIIKEVTK